MKAKLFIMIAAAATMFAACNKGEEPNVIDDGKINLTGGLSLFRSAGQGLQSEKIDATNTVGVFISEAVQTPTVNYDQNMQYTTDGNGALTPPAEKQPYFPVSGSKVNIYAYAPYDAAYTTLDAADNAFSVKADQSADADYISSDFIVGTPLTDVARSSGAVNISFTHKLSKIDFTLKAGTGFKASDLQGATVTIMNTKPDTKVNIKTGVVAAAEGTATDIKAVTFAADATTFTSSAIIIPQDLTISTKFIQVTLANGKTLSYSLEKAMTFDSGKKYIYEITANIESLDVTASIVDWNTGETIKGDVSLD